MLKQVQIKQLTKVQMEYRYYHCECLLKFGALTICTENPIIAGRIQMERFISGGMLGKKGNNLAFRGITIFSL